MAESSEGSPTSGVATVTTEQYRNRTPRLRIIPRNQEGRRIVRLRRPKIETRSDTFATQSGVTSTTEVTAETPPDPVPAPVPAGPDAAVPDAPAAAPVAAPVPTRPDSPPEPQAAQQERRSYDINIINVTEGASKRAHLEATDRVREMMREGKWYQFWKWPKKIGIRLAESGIVNIQKDRLLKAKAENNSSLIGFAAIRGAANELNEARAQGKAEYEAVLERFRQGKRVEGSETVASAQSALRQAITNDILKPITTGEVTTEDQVRQRLVSFINSRLSSGDTSPEVRDQLTQFFGAEANLFGDRAQLFATDLLATGLRLKADMESHNETLEQMDQFINIQLGNAKTAHQTDTRGFVDKAVVWAKQRRDNPGAVAATKYGLGFSGVILNPLVVGIAASLGSQGILKSVGLVGRAAAIPALFAGAVTGALVGGIRRYGELGRDRSMDLSQRAYGEQPENRRVSGAERIFKRFSGGTTREALTQFVYNTASVRELISGGGTELATGNTRKRVDQLLQELTTNPDNELARRDIYSRIAEIESRLDLSVQNKVDYLQYESQKVSTEVSKLKLYAEVARLRKALTSIPDAEANIETFKGQWSARLIDNRKDQDKAFQIYRLKKSAVAAGFGALVGLAGGVVAQQAGAWIGRANPDLGELPVVGGIFNKNQTVIEDGLNINEGLKPGVIDTRELSVRDGIRDMLQTNRHETFINGDMVVDINSLDANGNPIPGRMSMTFEPTGRNIMVHGETSILPDGRVDVKLDTAQLLRDGVSPTDVEAIKTELLENGWAISAIEQVPGKSEVVEILKHYEDEGLLNPTKRELWHDNQTPMRFVNGRWIGADGKELQFYHRVLPDGTIELDFSKMESHFQKGLWRNWDYTVDNQYNRVVNDIIRQPDGTRVYQNFEIMITPNEAANQARQAIIFNESTHPELRQGLLRFSPNSDEAKAFFQLDEQGRPIANKFSLPGAAAPTNFQKPSFIEVAHMQPNGLRTVLSTSQGEGVSQMTIKTPDLEVVHFEPPTGPDVTPIKDRDSLVAFDWIPRSPLEGTKKPESPVEETPGQPPEAPVIVEPPYGYGSDRYGRGQTVLGDLTSPVQEVEAEVVLPELLNQAYGRFGVPVEEQNVINDLTPPEQVHWLQQQVVNSGLSPTPPANLQAIETILGVPTSSRATRPTSATGSPTVISGARGSAPVAVDPAVISTAVPDNPPVTAYSAGTTTGIPNTEITAGTSTPVVPESASISPDDLKKDLDTFINLPASPVDPRNKIAAIREAEGYVDDPVLKQVENESGLKVNESVQLFKDAITWGAKQNQVDLVKPDASYAGLPYYARVKQIAEDNNWSDLPAETENATNRMIRYLQQLDPKYGLLTKGNLDINLSLLYSAINRIEVMLTPSP